MVGARVAGRVAGHHGVAPQRVRARPFAPNDEYASGAPGQASATRVRAPGILAQSVACRSSPGSGPMTEELRLILDLTIALAAALVGGAIAHRLRQSVIVGYLIAGMVIATVAPGLIGSLANIRALADVGIIFLMFALGIEFSLKELMRVRGVAIGGTLIQMGLLIALGIGLGALLGWPLEQGLFFGGVISVSSTAVILKTLLERGEVASPHGRTLLGMLIVQDLL